MTSLRRLADNKDATSLATRLRKRRFALFLQLLGRLPGRLRLLDVGGTPQFWDMMDLQQAGTVDLTLLNVEPVDTEGRALRCVIGDGRRMSQFADGEFDVVFSNSVIEHVGTLKDQADMAAEIARVGRSYFVQTPNRYFPIEPHFLLPGFQFLPIGLRVWILRRFNLPGYRRIPDRARARHEVTAIRLMTRSELSRLFPGSSLYVERFAGFAKSFVAYRGFERRDDAQARRGAARNLV